MLQIKISAKNVVVIVQALMTMHDGTFELKSKLREGTEVIAAFPRSRVTEALPPISEEQRRGDGVALLAMVPAKKHISTSTPNARIIGVRSPMMDSTGICFARGSMTVCARCGASPVKKPSAASGNRKSKPPRSVVRKRSRWISLSTVLS